MGEQSTEDYIHKHIQSVRKKMSEIAGIIVERAEHHDESKLKDPEFSGFIQMDKEPRYEYNSQGYKDKMKRFAWLFEHHWANNRHHPEFFKNQGGFESQANIVDIVEMLCDWTSYKKSISYTEAINIVHAQCKRFHFSETMENILLNTLRDYFVDFGGFKDLGKCDVKNDGYFHHSDKDYIPIVDVKA